MLDREHSRLQVRLTGHVFMFGALLLLWQSDIGLTITRRFRGGLWTATSSDKTHYIELLWLIYCLEGGSSVLLLGPGYSLGGDGGGVVTLFGPRTLCHAALG
jgi:hypothetical protein